MGLLKVSHKISPIVGQVLIVLVESLASFIHSCIGDVPAGHPFSILQSAGTGSAYLAVIRVLVTVPYKLMVCSAALGSLIKYLVGTMGEKEVRNWGLIESAGEVLVTKP
jgi:hypothetical protein